MGQINQAVKLDKVIKNFNIGNFIETGTGLGESLEYLLDLDESKDLDIHSIELMEQLYNILQAKFKSVENLDLIKGYSHEEIGKLMEVISDQPTIFWHDAHFPGADFKIDGATYTSEKDDTKRIPLESELRTIISSGRDVSNDVFIIDDLRVYKDGPYEGGNWEFRSQAGSDNIDFIYELFDETHIIIESYIAQGFVILFPITTSEEVCKSLIEGIFEE